MIDYSRILDKISRRFGSRLSGPGNGEAAKTPAPAEEPAPGPAEAPEEVSAPHGRTREVNPEMLTDLFREGEDAKPAEGAEPPASPGGKGPPFRNHATLLRFATGIIAEIEKSLRARARAKEK
jgi:hypothetical protein